MTSASGRKVAVVTGGTAGAGRAVVREFAKAGYDVAVLARGGAGLHGAASDVEDLGARALVLAVDVADYEAVQRAAARVEDDLGGIDVWVNAAFVGSLAFCWDTTMDEFHRITEVSYYGQVHGTLAALARMRPRNHGVIINVGSGLAHRSIPLQAAYCAAKHAVRGFTESVLTELAAERSAVKICTAALPALNTPQFNWNATRMPQHPMPVPPIFQPELAGKAVVFLAEHPRRTMWVGISTAYTILGARLAPRLLDYRLGRTGVQAQQSSQDLPRWGENLFEPRDETTDRGSRGSFSRQAHDTDPVYWLSRHRRAVLTGVSALTAVAIALATTRK